MKKLGPFSFAAGAMLISSSAFASEAGGQNQLAGAPAAPAAATPLAAAASAGTSWQAPAGPIQLAATGHGAKGGHGVKAGHGMRAGHGGWGRHGRAKFHGKHGGKGRHFRRGFGSGFGGWGGFWGGGWGGGGGDWWVEVYYPQPVDPCWYARAYWGPYWREGNWEPGAEGPPMRHGPGPDPDVRVYRHGPSDLEGPPPEWDGPPPPEWDGPPPHPDGPPPGWDGDGPDPGPYGYGPHGPYGWCYATKIVETTVTTAPTMVEEIHYREQVVKPRRHKVKLRKKCTRKCCDC